MNLVPIERHYALTETGPWSRVRVPQETFTQACEFWGDNIDDGDLRRVYRMLQKTLYAERKGKLTGGMVDLIETEEQLETYVQERLSAAATRVAVTSPERHSDDVAVDAMATAMKYKLALARGKGRSGWEECSYEVLNSMLHEHIAKGDPVDVANFCMFLANRGFGIKMPKQSRGPSNYRLRLLNNDNRTATVHGVTINAAGTHELAITVTGSQELTDENSVVVGYWQWGSNARLEELPVFSRAQLTQSDKNAGWKEYPIRIPKVVL